MDRGDGLGKRMKKQVNPLELEVFDANYSVKSTEINHLQAAHYFMLGE